MMMSIFSINFSTNSKETVTIFITVRELIKCSLMLTHNNSGLRSVIMSVLKKENLGELG